MIDVVRYSTMECKVALEIVSSSDDPDQSKSHKDVRTYYVLQHQSIDLHIAMIDPTSKILLVLFIVSDQETPLTDSSGQTKLT